MAALIMFVNSAQTFSSVALRVESGMLPRATVSAAAFPAMRSQWTSGPRMQMMNHPEEIDYDGCDSWDDQIAEQAAWMAQQQQLGHNPMQMGQNCMGDQGPGWMDHASHMGDQGHGGWMDQYQQMDQSPGGWMNQQQMSPRQVEIFIPEGCYPGMEFPVDVGGQRPFYVAVPQGLGPGMSFWMDMP